MERIVIIDHNEHELYIEDIPDEVIDSPDWKGEEEYIRENYDVVDFSWDFVVGSYYFPEDDKIPIKINFEDLDL